MLRRLLLAGVSLLLVSVFAAAGPALAIPEDGAGPNTPGTSGSVSPRQATAGATISFTVKGFPAGEVVYVKIDDGLFCTDSAVHGACVVHQQRLGASGSASGSFVLPGDLAPGKHWLRFLASEEIVDAQGRYLGTKGYTTRAGTEFTVVRGSSAPPSTPGVHTPTPAPTDGSTPTTDGATEVTVVPAGEVLVVAGDMTSGDISGNKEADTKDDAGSEPDADPDPAPGSQSPTVTVDTAPKAAAVVEDAGVPWVGLGGLVVLLVFAGGLLVRSRRA